MKRPLILVLLIASVISLGAFLSGKADKAYASLNCQKKSVKVFTPSYGTAGDFIFNGLFSRVAAYMEK